MSITTSTTVSEFTAVAEAALARVAGQTLISQGVCIDILLDLYIVTDDVGMRWSIGDRIEELRGREYLLEEDLRADLHAMLAIAEFTEIAESLAA